VSKLRENNKIVIGVGVKSSTSDLLIANCDEFIYYDDLVRKEEQRRGRRRPAAAPAAARHGQSKPGQPATVAPAPSGDVAAAARSSDDDLAASVASSRAPADSKPAAPSRRGQTRAKTDDEKKQEAFDLVLTTIEALADERDTGEKVWGSMIKQALKRQRPGFNESYHGFRSFNQLLEEARDRKLLELEKDEKSGGYVVRPVAG
jgi:hypothetical protein